MAKDATSSALDGWFETMRATADTPPGCSPTACRSTSTPRFPPKVDAVTTPDVEIEAGLEALKRKSPPLPQKTRQRWGIRVACFVSRALHP
jgi:hypothetical protein